MCTFRPRDFFHYKYGAYTDMHVDGSQLPDGFKILLFVVTPGTSDWDDLYRGAHYDAQVTITLDASFVRIDFKKSEREVQKLSRLLQ